MVLASLDLTKGCLFFLVIFFTGASFLLIVVFLFLKTFKAPSYAVLLGASTLRTLTLVRATLAEVVCATTLESAFVVLSFLLHFMSPFVMGLLLDILMTIPNFLSSTAFIEYFSGSLPFFFFTFMLDSSESFVDVSSTFLSRFIFLLFITDVIFLVTLFSFFEASCFFSLSSRTIIFLNSFACISFLLILRL